MFCSTGFAGLSPNMFELRSWRRRWQEGAKPDEAAENEFLHEKEVIDWGECE